VVKDGIPFVAVPLIIFAILLFFKLWLIALPFLLIAAFMAYFFRDPNREIPVNPDLVVSPADGLITRIEKLGDNAESTTVVSIFLSPLDVHINRSPIAGKITSQRFQKGKFKMATREDASLVNEQNILEIKGEKITVVCKQIAGIVARRIVCWKHVGDDLKMGERFGLIKFSSRTDLILPANVELLVEKGNRVQGGTTVIGRIKNV
jgi:phosphatidylserine decarboxylase